MSVVVIGLNHRTAPLHLLERMTVGDDAIVKALHDISSRPNVREAVVLSTCNRTEVYAIAERFHGAFADVRDFLAHVAELPPEDFADHLYVLYDEAAVGHLFAVAAGIDSAVVGESEILGQVGEAWDRARAEGVAASGLNLLFRHALEVGKRARAETGIGRHTTSVSQAAVAMAGERLDGLADRRVLVLGAGEMGERMAVLVASAGAAEVLVANRTWDNAAAVAERAGGRAIRLSDLADALVDADVLFTSTGATALLVAHADLAPAIEKRRGRPLLIVDIAVPRDVDPTVADLPGVTLLDMEDLRAFAEAGLVERRREVGNVRRIIDEEVERHRALATAREAAPLVSELRDRADSIRAAELERFAGRLAGLDERTRAVVGALTEGIVAKLLHEPTIRLKDAAGTPRGERLAESIRELFDL